MPDPKYASHLPILLKIVDQTSGPILELGMGLWSTPILDLMCRGEKRPLVSYDNDPKWFKENEKWRSDYHEVNFVTDWNEAKIEQTHWSVVLVDHRPAKRRRDEIRRLANNADYIVVHDTEPETNQFYRYTWIYKLFKFRYNYTKCRPHTTVLSNFFDVSKIIKI